MEYRKFTLILLAGMTMIIFVGGCETIRNMTSKGYTELCQNFIGKDSQYLIDQWGYPNRNLKASNGNQVFFYQEVVDPFDIDMAEHTPLIGYPPIITRPVTTGGVTSGFDAGRNCMTYFEVDKSNKILKSVWKGDCRAKEISGGH